MTPNLLRQAAMLLTNLLDFNSPADAKLGEFFRNNRELGTKDRAFVAESVYGVLRRLRYLSAVTANEAGDPDDARKLILAWLLRVQGKSIRELEPILNEQQTEWAQAIKAKSTENLPLPGLLKSSRLVSNIAAWRNRFGVIVYFIVKSIMGLQVHFYWLHLFCLMH